MSEDDRICVLDAKTDKKIDAQCLLIDISIGNYIRLIENNLEELDIQRGKILSKKRDVYRRLIEDLKEGTLIPPLSIVLMKNSEVQKEINEMERIEDIEKLINEKIKQGDIFILDGLQRTYCILSVIDDLGKIGKKEQFLTTRIRVELWYNMRYTAILYKMLVLNTGQVKMSMKHQIEILNIPLKEKIIEVATVKGTTIAFSTYRNPLSVDEVYKYRFSDIVEAFTSFITNDPMVDKTNEVVKQLERMKFIEDHSDPEILSKEEEVNEFIETLIALDKEIWNKYPQSITIEDEEGNESSLPWTSRRDIMTSAAILSGIFAAFGKIFKNEREKYRQRKTQLFHILREDNVDPLKLEVMSQILQDEKTRSTKFGETTRNFFFNALKKFFDGEDNFGEIWQRVST